MSLEVLLIMKFMNTCMRNEKEIKESMRREAHKASFPLIKAAQYINMIK